MEIRYGNLIENSRAFKALSRDHESGSLAHAYIFISPDKVGLRLLTNFFLAKIIHQNNPIVLKRVFENSYFDIIKIPRTINNGTDEKVSAADADYIAETCYMTGAELDQKYYVISPDEPLSEAVQNKLLKILEEPPNVARFIIHASTETELLPTIYSRARVVRLDAFDKADILQQLNQYFTDEVAISLACAACRGQIGLAQEMVTNLRYKQMYEQAYSVLKFMTRSPEILPYAAVIITLKDYLPLFIDFLELILIDVIALSSGSINTVNMRNNTYDLASLTESYSVNICLKLMPLLNKARLRIKANCNANSIVDELLFSILEVKAKCQK